MEGRAMKYQDLFNIVFLKACDELLQIGKISKRKNLSCLEKKCCFSNNCKADGKILHTNMYFIDLNRAKI